MSVAQVGGDCLPISQRFNWETFGVLCWPSALTLATSFVMFHDMRTQIATLQLRFQPSSISCSFCEVLTTLHDQMLRGGRHFADSRSEICTDHWCIPRYADACKADPSRVFAPQLEDGRKPVSAVAAVPIFVEACLGISVTHQDEVVRIQVQFATAVGIDMFFHFWPVRPAPCCAELL